jgi:hypothetical protein
VKLSRVDTLNDGQRFMSHGRWYVLTGEPDDNGWVRAVNVEPELEYGCGSIEHFSPRMVVAVDEPVPERAWVTA